MQWQPASRALCGFHLPTAVWGPPRKWEWLAKGVFVVLSIYKKVANFVRMPIYNMRQLTLSVPISYQQPTSPYITHTKKGIW